MHFADVCGFSLGFTQAAAFLVQGLIYPSGKMHIATKLVWSAILVGSLGLGVAEGYFGLQTNRTLGLSWLTYNAYAKALATVLKYSFQIYLNFRSQNVSGLSPLMFKIDFLGGSLAILQMQVDAIIAGQGFIFTDSRVNLAKLLLSIASVSGDCIILAQYYCVYRKPSRATDRLLG